MNNEVGLCGGRVFKLDGEPAVGAAFINGKWGVRKSDAVLIPYHEGMAVLLKQKRKAGVKELKAAIHDDEVLKLLGIPKPRKQSIGYIFWQKTHH